MSSNLRPFHLAFPVSDLSVAKKWYTEIIGCSIGRESKEWIDFNMFGHQVVAHLTSESNEIDTNMVDGENIPIRHFGVILDWEQWHKFSNRIKDQIEFVIEPYIRFKGQTGEQATMFFLDPDKNALEFKAFKNDNMIFKK